MHWRLRRHPSCRRCRRRRHRHRFCPNHQRQRRRRRRCRSDRHLRSRRRHHPPFWECPRRHPTWRWPPLSSSSLRARGSPHRCRNRQKLPCSGRRAGRRLVVRAGNRRVSKHCGTGPAHRTSPVLVAGRVRHGLWDRGRCGVTPGLDRPAT